jgi:hypothetical protein
LLELQRRPKQSHLSLLKSRENLHELSRSCASGAGASPGLVAEGAEEWIESEEEELEADDRTQSEEEEDANAASASAPFDANDAFVAAFAAASEENARASASASDGAGAGASDRAVAIASAIASVSAGAYFGTRVALAAASTPTSALGARLREKVEDLQEAMLEFQAAEWARRKADKEAADAHEAHCLILAKIRRCAKWMVSLQARNLRLEMLPGQSPSPAPGPARVQKLISAHSPAPALGPARVQELINQAKEHGQKLLALEASAKASVPSS